MAEIELVVRIDEKLYRDIYSDAEIMIYGGMRSGKMLFATLLRAIRNSKPLPKGHGDLIDRDAVNSRYDGIYAELDSLSNKPTYKVLLDKLSMCLDTAVLIIEADKEQEV